MGLELTSILIDLAHTQIEEIPRISKSWWAEMESGRESGHETRSISVPLHHRHQSIIVLIEDCIRSQGNTSANWLLIEPTCLVYS